MGGRASPYEAVEKSFMRPLQRMPAPAALLPQASTRLVACRWRLAYALGFIRGTFGPQPGM